MSCVTKRSLSSVRSAGAIQIAAHSGHPGGCGGESTRRCPCRIRRRRPRIRAASRRSGGKWSFSILTTWSASASAWSACPVEDARPDDVRACVVVEHRLVLERLLGVGEDGQRVVVDLDQVGRVARELTRRRADGGDRLAHVSHPADGERVVAVPAGLHGHLEERSVWIATSSPVIVPWTPSSSAATSMETMRACAYGDRTSGRIPSRGGARRRRTRRAPGRAACPHAVGSTAPWPSRERAASRFPPRWNLVCNVTRRHAYSPGRDRPRRCSRNPCSGRCCPGARSEPRPPSDAGSPRAAPLRSLSIPGVQ